MKTHKFYIFMSNPEEYDAVLGSDNPAPDSAGVLGGIAGVKRRLLSQVIEYRISALSDALKYGHVGLGLVIQALNDSEIKVHKAAYELLKNREELEVQSVLSEHISRCYFFRYNGLYKTRFNPINGNSHFLRFYQDGTVLFQTIVITSKEDLDVDIAPLVATWFKKEDKSIKRGVYKLENNVVNICRYSCYPYGFGKVEMYGHTVSLNLWNDNAYIPLEYYFVHIPNIQI